MISEELLDEIDDIIDRNFNFVLSSCINQGDDDISYYIEQSIDDIKTEIRELLTNK